MEQDETRLVVEQSEGRTPSGDVDFSMLMLSI